MTRARHRRRVSDRRRGARGFTLIELLLSLALLALLTSFIAGGLVFARRAFLLDRTADRGLETDAAIETLSNLLASAVPLEAKDAGATRHVAFDGTRDGVSFLGFGTGHAMRGGLHVIRIKLDDGDLVADITPTQGHVSSNTEAGLRRVVLLTKVKRTQFDYFGRLDQKTSQAWRNDWSKAETLPLQISCQLAFEDDRPPPPMLIATLHQRE